MHDLFATFRSVLLSLSFGFGALPCSAPAQNSTTTGGTVTGGSVTGGSVTGGSVTGGSVTGGSVTGGSVKGSSVTGSSVTGSSVKGGSVTGGSVTGGSVTAGTVTPGTVTPGTVTPGTATAVVAGREVTATTAGSVSVHSEGDKAIVTLGAHTLILEKERLLLDGKERAKLPAGASKIGIEAAKGHLIVRADGKEVLRTDLGKPE